MDKFYNSYIEFDSYDNYSTEKKELFREFIKDNFLPKEQEKNSNLTMLLMPIRLND